MERLSFKVREVEGPLDLILELIAKHKLNIYDIAIVDLLTQYMAYVQSLREQNLEVASEFLEMAARLVHMKTLSLLPKHQELEELKGELTGQLLEYRALKMAALELKARCRMGEFFVREPIELPKAEYSVLHSPQALLEAYCMAMGKGQRRQPPPAAAFTGIVSRQVVSVSSRIAFLLGRLHGNPRLPFDSLFLNSRGRSELVATFLALLELVRDGSITVSADGKEVALRPGVSTAGERGEYR